MGLDFFVFVFWMDFFEIFKFSWSKMALKGIFLGIALLGIVWQYYNGKSKGKNWAEALVDDESIIDITINALPSSSTEEE